MVYEWWKFWQTKTEPYGLTAGLDHVLALSRMSNAMRRSPGNTEGVVLVPVVVPYNQDPEKFMQSSVWRAIWLVSAALELMDDRLDDVLTETIRLDHYLLRDLRQHLARRRRMPSLCPGEDPAGTAGSTNSA